MDVSDWAVCGPHRGAIEEVKLGQHVGVVLSHRGGLCRHCQAGAVHSRGAPLGSVGDSDDHTTHVSVKGIEV